MYVCVLLVNVLHDIITIIFLNKLHDKYYNKLFLLERFIIIIILLLLLLQRKYIILQRPK